MLMGVVGIIGVERMEKTMDQAKKRSLEIYA
jgi:hypothetical protein